MTKQILIRAGGRETSAVAEAGERLLTVLQREGFAVAAPCGGNGSCGKCLVMLRDGAGERRVLACQTPVESDGELLVEELTGGAILTGAAGEARSAHSGSGLAAAMDLGTTTVVLELFDLHDGSRKGVAAAWNAQAPYGADVISRAQFCMEHEDGVQTLQRAIRTQTERLLAQLGARREELRALFVAGNTIMQHLYAGLDPAPIARAPFTPKSLFTGDEPKERGLRYAPCVAGYVGGDMTAGLLSSGLYEHRERALYIDLGTNGEMALGGSEGFLCCAVASGPAFEGAGIACGMPGVAGAVSHVRWDGGELRCEVIGGGEAKGLCGSGLVDLLALLCEKRIVSATGRLPGPKEAPEEARPWLGEDENGNGIFYLTADRRVYLTASDVRKLQLAKAAVAAGIRVLLKKSGLALAQVDRLVLSGGFGSFMDIRSAAAIGMLPAELTDRAASIGNASLAGARMALLEPEAGERLLAIQRACRYVELSGDADFNEEFPEQMFFYEEDDELWN